MNSISVLSQQVETMYGRLAKLYRSINNSSSASLELLPAALKELGVASEKMQLMMQELVRQNEQLMMAQKQIEAERQRYQHLFELAADAYIITNLEGTIQEANRVAVTLLNTQHPCLLGEPLVNYVAPDGRSLFNTKLAQLTQRNRLDFVLRFQQYNNHPLDMAFTVQVVHNPVSDSASLHWLLRDITERKRAEAALDRTDYDPCHDRPIFYYTKGDTIPLDPQTLWLVHQGNVKLTTLSDRGEEVLVGLAGKSMIFGASLTALQAYQASALSNVELVSLARTEIAQSPRLAQALLVLINQRLRQSEGFLAIYGHIRVEDRLTRLLQLLKQEVGQPIESGTRLSVRLTHQELASACCTTRVTITRLMGRLQQQGLISFDKQNYLILKNKFL